MRLMKTLNILTGFSIIPELIGRLVYRPQFFLNPAPNEMGLFVFIAVLWVVIIALFVVTILILFKRSLKGQLNMTEFRNQMALFVGLMIVFLAVAFV